MDDTRFDDVISRRNSEPCKEHRPIPKLGLSKTHSVAQLAGAGLRTAQRIMTSAWRLETPQQAVLLGLPESTLLALYEAAHSARDVDGVGEDTLTRLSLIAGIYGDLQSFYQKDRDFAEVWVSLPNSNATFGGVAPIEQMMQGDIDSLWRVRRHTQAMLSLI